MVLRGFSSAVCMWLAISNGGMMDAGIEEPHDSLPTPTPVSPNLCHLHFEFFIAPDALLFFLGQWHRAHNVHRASTNLPPSTRKQDACTVRQYSPRIAMYVSNTRS